MSGIEYFLSREEVSLAGSLLRPCEMVAASMNWFSLNWRDGLAN